MNCLIYDFPLFVLMNFIVNVLERRNFSTAFIITIIIYKKLIVHLRLFLFFSLVYCTHGYVTYNCGLFNEHLHVPVSELFCYSIF